jgi:hypothetical protein
MCYGMVDRVDIFLLPFPSHWVSISQSVLEDQRAGDHDVDLMVVALPAPTATLDFLLYALVRVC